ncbi:DUF2795 domain-containing protein [Spiractinospora alimapuensis]|uniref:DUF2795 domain-containing protein n=1 Tax=Spiractinospora alimapuensis TaxID=2820884 RepID=UPI001F459620|nr:DUF2795 domain-containing protein [Spiractinospora alimapuensis]QVQ51576.1 DUF2795 domain-containing protein [Spiractinospora alimapuensis]
MSVKRGREGLRQILDTVEFPVDQPTMVVLAQEAGADEELLSALQAIPRAVYNEPNEILRSVPVQDRPHSHTESARTRERHEQAREPSAIEEELGQNPEA